MLKVYEITLSPTIGSHRRLRPDLDCDLAVENYLNYLRAIGTEPLRELIRGRSWQIGPVTYLLAVPTAVTFRMRWPEPRP